LIIYGLLFLILAAGCSPSSGNEEDTLVNFDMNPTLGTTTAPTQGGETGPVFIITTAEGDRQVTEDWSEAESKLPFSPIVPTYIPGKFALEKVFISLPRETSNKRSYRRNIRVRLNFGNNDGSGFSVQQRILEEGMSIVRIDGPGNKSEVNIAGTRGQIVEDDDQGLVILAWHGCGINFSLAAPTTPVLHKEEIIDIANSTEECHILR
jgi:hypothetical protein